MKIHTQSALVILGTLIIGIVLGSVLSTAFMNQRIQRIPDMMGPGAFHQFVIEEMIHPVDDDQRRQLEAITRRTGQRTVETMQNFRAGMKGIMDSLLIDVKPILNEKQYLRLKNHIENTRSFKHGCDKPFKRGMQRNKKSRSAGSQNSQGNE